MGKKVKKGYCRVCGNKIEIMAFRGTEFCSDVCKKKVGADITSVGTYMFVTNQEKSMIDYARGRKTGNG